MVDGLLLLLLRVLRLLPLGRVLAIGSRLGGRHCHLLVLDLILILILVLAIVSNLHALQSGTDLIN